MTQYDTACRGSLTMRSGQRRLNHVCISRSAAFRKSARIQRLGYAAEATDGNDVDNV